MIIDLGYLATELACKGDEVIRAASHSSVNWALIKNLRSLASIIQSLFTVLAIIAGLIWFIKRRERAPRANVEHQVVFARLNKDTVYVGITVLIKNIGRVKIEPRVAEPIASLVQIEELAPYLSKVQKSQEHSPEYELKFLGKRTFPKNVLVEPNEIQPVLFEFLIQGSTKSIKVYSHVDNSYNKGKGWDTTTIHEVDI